MFLKVAATAAYCSLSDGEVLRSTSEEPAQKRAEFNFYGTIKVVISVYKRIEFKLYIISVYKAYIQR